MCGCAWTLEAPLPGVLVWNPVWPWMHAALGQNVQGLRRSFMAEWHLVARQCAYPRRLCLNMLQLFGALIFNDDPFQRPPDCHLRAAEVHTEARQH